jgi:low affinity Fe/Cu permease
MMLSIYRITSAVLLGLLALMPFIFWRNIIFATFATTVITLVLILIAFQVRQLRTLAGTIAKLEELMELLRDTRRELSTAESNRSSENSRKSARGYCKRAHSNARDPDENRYGANIVESRTSRRLSDIFRPISSQRWSM